MATSTTSETVLGLDLGIASVGWAVVGHAGGLPQSIIACGVRHFEEGVSNAGQGEGEKSHATDRRAARGQRRNLERRARKLNKVYRLLEAAGMVPRLDVPAASLRDRKQGSAAKRRRAEDAIKAARHEMLLDLDYGKKDESGRRPGKNDAGHPKCLVARHWKPDLPVERLLPYFLRAEALKCPLSLDEMGRALFHLAQRKGAWWNRKDAAAESEQAEDSNAESTPAEKKNDRDKEERGVVKASLQRLEGKLEDFGRSLGRDATLGEYLYAVLSKNPKAMELEREYHKFELCLCSTRDGFNRKQQIAKAIDSGIAPDTSTWIEADKKLLEAWRKGKKARKFLEDVKKAEVLPKPTSYPARNRRNASDRFTKRSMFKAEFNAIWDRQLELHRTPQGDARVLAALESKIVIPARNEKRDKKGRVVKPARESREKSLREELFRAMFFQRKLKNASHLIGCCELEDGLNRRREYCENRTEADAARQRKTHLRQRAPLAHPWASRFRMLQMVNNTRVYEVTKSGYAPIRFEGGDTDEERARSADGFLPRDKRVKLSGRLAHKGTLSWNVARTELEFGPNTAFNWELQTKNKKGKRGKEVATVQAHKEFLGDRTTAKFVGIFGADAWDKMWRTRGKSGMSEAEEVFWEWYACQDQRALSFIGATRWKLPGLEVADANGLPPEQVQAECNRLVEEACKERKADTAKLVRSGLQRAEARFGKITFKKDSPADRFGNLALPEGYSRLSTAALKRVLTDKHWGMEQGHPYPTAKDRLYAAPQGGLKPGVTPTLMPVKAIFPSLNNPVVIRTLTETRLVVNEIVTRLLGGTLPDVVRVEMARDLAANREQREQIQLRSAVNRSANEKAAVILGYSKEDAWKAAKDLIRKVQLAQECGWQCPYCGNCFSMADLHNGGAEVEHIIPRAILPDNGFGNLTLGHQTCNAVKGRRTPSQAKLDFEAKGWRWDDIAKRVAAFRRVEKYAEIERCWPVAPCAGQTGEREYLTDDDEGVVEEPGTPEAPQQKGKRQRRTHSAAKAREGESKGRGHPKLRLFTLDGAALQQYVRNFTSADLQNTRYITKVAAGYLATLYGNPADRPHEKAEATPGGRKEQRIQVTNGQITSILRDGLGEWGRKCKSHKNKQTGEETVKDWWISCNHVLDDGGSREPGDARNPLSVERGKKKRDDHRHNTVDAILVAIANPAEIRGQLAQAAAQSELVGWHDGYKWGTVQEAVLPLWKSFYQDLRAAIHETDHFNCGVKGVVVSHRVQTGVAGPLHDQTNRSPKRAIEIRPGIWRVKDGNNSVTVIRVGDGIRERLVKPGENHHVEVFQTPDEDWKAQIVSLFDLAQRLRRGQPIIADRHGDDHTAQFRWALHKGDVLRLADGTFRIVRGFSAEQKAKGPYIRVKHVAHFDARLEKAIPDAEIPEDPIATLFGRKGAEKVTNTPLGEVRPVND